MQCVILAAGEGVRMRPLTNSVPKPLLLVGGRPLLEHLLDALPAEIEEVILVIGYLGQKIRDHFGERYKKIRIRYVEQTRAQGTYAALALCKNELHGPFFLVLYADDLHSRSSLADCVRAKESCVLVQHASHPERFGVVDVDARGYVRGIEEKPAHPKSTLVLTGPTILSPRIFDFPPGPAANGEWYLATAIAGYAREIPVRVIEGKGWIPIGYPEDLEKAENALIRKMNGL